MSESPDLEGGDLRLPLVSQVRAIDLIGREAELRRVADMFRAGARAVVLSGLAGIGKSALAAAAAGESGLWVSLAENSAGGAPTSARSIMAAILQHSGQDPGSDVEAAFSEASRSHPRMIVLDDVRQPREVRQVIAAAPSVRFVVTTRSPFPHTVRHEASMEVAGLDDEAAGDLLVNRGVPLRSAAADATVRAALDILAGHPLSLVLFAGAVAQRPGWTMEDHVERLAGAGGDELTDALTSLRSSLEEVGEAVRALRLLAHVPRGRIDLDLAATYLADDYHYVESLARAGLVLVEDGNVRIHDIVAQVARRDSAREDRPGWVAGRMAALTAALLDRITAAVLATVPQLRRTLGWIPETVEPMSIEASAQWLEKNLPLVLALGDHARFTGDHRTFLRIAQLIGFWGPDTSHTTTLVTLCRTARHVADLHGTVLERYYAERLLGRSLERLGRWAEARRAHRNAVELAVAIGDSALEARARYGVASTTESLGDLASSIKEFDQICSIFESGDPGDLAQTLAGMVVILWRVGEVQRSVATGKRALALMDGSDPVTTGMTHANLVEPHLLLGDLEGARQCAASARSIVSSVGSVLLDSFIDSQFAYFSAIDGNTERAEEEFDRIATCAREIGAPFLLAQSENYRGMARLRAGDREGARAAFRRVLDATDAYGGDHLLATEGLAAASGGPVRWRGHMLWAAPPSSDDDSSWGLLTAREGEVAELVADGLRDSEIARTLVLSPRTVETHVASIRRKLGVASRAGIGRALTR